MSAWSGVATSDGLDRPCGEIKTATTSTAYRSLHCRDCAFSITTVGLDKSQHVPGSSRSISVDMLSHSTHRNTGYWVRSITDSSARVLSAMRYAMFAYPRVCFMCLNTTCSSCTRSYIQKKCKKG